MQRGLFYVVWMVLGVVLFLRVPKEQVAQVVPLLFLLWCTFFVGAEHAVWHPEDHDE